MEKWKIAVIVLLIAGICGYGFYQQNPPATVPVTSEPTPEAKSKLLKLVGQQPPAWNIPQKLWYNTPAPIGPNTLKGKVTLLEFWRVGCHHCQETVPLLNKLFEKYKPQGVQFVAIHSPGNLTDPENPELDWAGVKTTMKQWGVEYPVAYDEKGKLFRETYGGDLYPSVLIVGRDGKIAHVQTGHTPEKEQELLRALETIVKKK